MFTYARRFCRYQVDSGWAWVVCLASFFGQSVIFGTIQSFGTLFISLLNDFNYGESATAWVGSLGYGFLFVIGPVTTVLCEHFGCRVMACTGSLITTFSLVLTSFASSIPSMYFTFGVLWGTGGSFVFFSGLLILRFYFNKNLSFANGITMTGAGFGTLVFNIILQEVESEYGWRGGMRALSVFAALTFVGSCAFIPPPEEYMPFERPNLRFRLKRLIDPRPWRDRAFPIWVLSLSFILFAYFFPYTYLVKMAVTLGIPVSQGALLIGYFSIAAIFGKLASGRLADIPRVRRIYIFVTSAIILSVSFMCVTAAKTYHGLLAYAITAGFFDGCFVVTVPLITQDIVGKELMAKALGNLYGVVAFPLTLGPPVLGQLYKSTGSFTITFFVSAAFVLVGVSLIYVVQRLRPDLVRKPPLTMEEVIFSLTPSIHSLSVVDTLSGLCVTEPSLPASNLDPMEFASYQRFDSSPREDSRTNFVDNVPSKMATQAEIETVYRQAIERMSREMKSNSCSRKSSNISNVTRSSVPVQLSDGSARGSVMSTAAVTSDICNPSGLLIDQGEKCSLSQSSEDKTAIEEEGGEHSDVQEDRNQESLVLLDGSSTAPEGQPASTNLVPSPKDLQEENDNIKDNDLVLQTQQETHVFPQQSNVHETALEGASKEIDASQHVPSALDQGALQDNDDTKPLLNCNHPSEEEISAEGTREANEILELVRIPPPPSVPRTGRLVALGLEEKSVQDRETTSLAEPEGSLLSNASLSEISFDTGGNDQFSPREVSPPKRRRPHLAFVDQLNLLSERLEAVAARQVQEEELGDGMVVDQRPVFSPAMQSLHLTPLYSANQSVPLTPARTWSSFVNTPVPTPRHTQQSAVHTSTVPTPIPTPQTLSHSVSGVFNVCTDAPTSNIIQTQNSSNVFDVQCSPTPSQASDSGRRSGGSSLPEMGQGSMHAFGSKRSSCTGSSIANDSISVGDLNSVGEPIDVIGTATRESDGAHMNSPVNPILNEEMDSAMTNCVQHAHLQSEDRRNPFLDPCLSNHQTELTAPDAQKWANQQNESVNRQISHVHEAEGSRFNNETQASLPQHWPFIRIEMENDSSKEQFHQQPVALNPFDKDDECGIPQRQNQEDTSEVEDSDASFKLDQNIVPIEGSSNLLGFPIIKQSLDSNSDSQQGESSEVPQIPCFHKNEVCIAIPDTNDSTNRIKSDPIEVPSTQQRQLPKIAAETEQNPFLDTETKVRSQRNPFKERDLRSEVCDPTEPLHGMETDSITVPSHEIQRDFNSNSHSGQDHSFKDDQHVLFQENGLHERRGVHDDGHNFTATDAVDLTNLNSFLDPREEEFKKIYSENSPLQPITLTNAQDVTDVPQNIPHHSAVGLKTDSNNETAVLAECVFNKDTQLIYNDCTLPVDNSLKKSDRVSLSPQGAFRSQPQHGDADLVGKEMGPEDDLQETNLPTQPEPTQTELTALETIKVAGRRECDQDADSKNDWTTFSHGEEVLIFEMDTDTELTDSANSSSDSTYNKQERPFDVDQSTLFPPLQVFSDDKFLIDDHGPTTPQKLPPPPRQVQRKRIDTPISITEKLLSQSASGDSHENTKGITTEGMRKENQEEFTPKEHLTHENDTCPVLTEDDSSVAENTLSEIQSDLLSDSKLEQTNIPCSSRLSDNSISEILCEEFEADEVKEEINNPNLEQGSTKSSIHDDIAPLLMQSEESIQYLNLRDLPVDSGVLRGRTSTTSSADNSSISSTSTDSSLSENETPYCKLQECLSDSSEHG